MTAPKVMIIGLDSVPPSLAFETFRSQMPNLSRLCRNGTFGPLLSTDPPITVPAWVSMTTGKTPGQLGIYGFQQHTDANTPRLTNQEDVRFPRIWELADAAGQRSAVVSVPLTYPAAPSHRTQLTTGFLTPNTHTRWATRPSLAKELEERFGEYIIDVTDFRSGDTEGVFARCVQFTRQHFAIFRHLIETSSPHFAMLVDLGPDRLHHAALRYIHPSHPSHIPSEMGRQYYRLLDEEIGRTLELADRDTLVMVVSDHGVKPLNGCFCINELLIRHGYLVLRQPYPITPTPLEQLQVDWSRTVAFATGGYVGRIYLTQRSPAAANTPNASSATLLQEIERRICDVSPPSRTPFHHRIFRAESLYPNAHGHPPALTIYFDDLNLRAAGTVGHNTLLIDTNDLGPDDANHDYFGIFAMNRKTPTQPPFQIYDVFATAVDALGLSIPPQTGGRVLNQR